MNIYITGVGAFTSIGSNVSELWEGLLAGKQGVKPVSLFDTSNHTHKYACEISNLQDFVERDKKVGRTTSLFLIAMEEALHDADISLEELKTMKVGIVVGTTLGEVEPFENKRNENHIGGPHVIADKIQNMYELRGPNWTITNACAAGNFSIIKAMEEIQLGRADLMIAGGVDVLSWASFTGFSSLKAMSPDFCRPFDVNRKGLILGEGAGVLIIESAQHFKKRSLGRAKAKLKGYGINCDAHHITAPDPHSLGAMKAMTDALKMGKVCNGEIDYINAHGTGTEANDNMEAKAMNSIFGEEIKTSSIKGNIGHTLGAASAIEAVVCTKILESQWIPPTLNLKTKDLKCQVRVIAQQTTLIDSRYILSNAFAFGGINSSILLEKI